MTAVISSPDAASGAEASGAAHVSASDSDAGTGTETQYITVASSWATNGASQVDIIGFEYVASISKWCALGSGLGF